jgi:hypothetical protein
VVQTAFIDYNRPSYSATLNRQGMYYNFCRIHQTLRVTPAMEARITDHVWEVREIVGLLG